MKNSQWAIGVDIGGTKIDIAQVAESGEVLQKERFLTDPKTGPKVIIKTLSAAIKTLKKNITTPPVGIGVAMAGQINPNNGLVHFAPNLDWHDVPLQEELQNLLDLPVIVTNDVRAATWGEWKYGSGQGCQDLICLFLGTGVGGGIVIAGHILNGASNTAGELGHMIINLNGPACTCGSWGCLEALAGGWAIAKQAQKAMNADPEAGKGIERLINEINEEISAKIVIAAYRAGDPLALVLIQNVMQAVSAGAINIVNAFNPKRLILGGGLVEGLPELISEVDKSIRQRALPAACESLQILSSGLKQNAGVVGAATLALNTF